MRANHSPSTVLPGQLPLLPFSVAARRELAAALLSGMLSRTRRRRVVVELREPRAELARLAPPVKLGGARRG